MKTNQIKHTNRGFTLIELLVSMAIIGILASMLMQGAQIAMRMAKQTKDVNNVKGLGLALISEAIDGEGRFRVGLKREDTKLEGSTLDVLQGLINDGVIGDPALVAGNGAVKARKMEITNDNIGFQYVAGWDTSASGRMPLLFTKGVTVTRATMTNDVFQVQNSAWNYDGMAVCYTAGNATWIKGKKDGGAMKLTDVLALGSVPDGIVIYK